MKQSLVAIILALSIPTQINATSSIHPTDSITNSQKLVTEILNIRDIPTSSKSPDFISNRSIDWEINNFYAEIKATQTKKESTNTYNISYTTQDEDTIITVNNNFADEFINSLTISNRYSSGNTLSFSIIRTNDAHYVECILTHPNGVKKDTNLLTSDYWPVVEKYLDWKLGKVMQLAEIRYNLAIDSALAENPPEDNHDSYDEMFRIIEKEVEKLVTSSKELTNWKLRKVAKPYTKLIDNELKQYEKNKK